MPKASSSGRSFPRPCRQNEGLPRLSPCLSRTDAKDLISWERSVRSLARTSAWPRRWGGCTAAWEGSPGRIGGRASNRRRRRRLSLAGPGMCSRGRGRVPASAPFGSGAPRFDRPGPAASARRDGWRSIAGTLLGHAFGSGVRLPQEAQRLSRQGRPVELNGPFRRAGVRVRQPCFRICCRRLPSLTGRDSSGGGGYAPRRTATAPDRRRDPSGALSGASGVLGREGSWKGRGAFLPENEWRRLPRRPRNGCRPCRSASGRPGVSPSRADSVRRPGERLRPLIL